MLPRPTPGTSSALWSCPNLRERLAAACPNLRERLAAALSCSHRGSRQHLPARSRLLPSATLQLRAAFSLSLRLPSVGRLAFRRRMEKHQGYHLLSPLGAEIHSEKQSPLWGRYPGQDPPTGGWDRALDTQKQQRCALVPSHWVLGLIRWPPPSSSTLCCPLICFRVAHCPAGVYVERQARKGRGEGGRDSSCSEPTNCSEMTNCSVIDSLQTQLH